MVRERRRRRIETTGQLVALIKEAVPSGYRHGRIHCATRTFQALRIAVNRELDQLSAMLAALPELMATGGIAAVLSFHSLEDRLVKQAFKDDGKWRRINKKVMQPCDEEREHNPRSRSAKLRLAERLSLDAVGRSAGPYAMD